MVVPIFKIFSLKSEISNFNQKSIYSLNMSDHSTGYLIPGIYCVKIPGILGVEIPGILSLTIPGIFR